MKLDLKANVIRYPTADDVFPRLHKLDIEPPYDLPSQHASPAT
jgi:hypothetical protein